MAGKCRVLLGSCWMDEAFLLAWQKGQTLKLLTTPPSMEWHHPWVEPAVPSGQKRSKSHFASQTDCVPASCTTAVLPFIHPVASQLKADIFQPLDCRSLLHFRWHSPTNDMHIPSQCTVVHLFYLCLAMVYTQMKVPSLACSYLCIRLTQDLIQGTATIIISDCFHRLSPSFWYPSLVSK